MIKNYLHNICLIFFALFAPIYLPAGGIQRNLNSNIYHENSKQITLASSCTFYCSPELNSEKLRVVDGGSTVLILREWIGVNHDKWVRVELSNHNLLKNSALPSRGWIQI
tara:strand:+ start:1766 stop:2095 length:330 start_codon:yes stop_codon:yes gene_type:complete